MNIAFFGSSLVSAYWNGAATYYRGIIRALDELGHRVIFYEPDAYDRQNHRDIPDPAWAKVVVYPATEEAAQAHLERAGAFADVIVKTSGVGVLDAFLEAGVVAQKKPSNTIIFWDVDAPATLDRVDHDPADPFRDLIPQFDLILTYGGGQPVISGYGRFDAQECIPIYNALDPRTHFPAAPNERFKSDFALLANRLPDREQRVEEFFLRAAALAPEKQFLLGGNGWQDKSMPPNVRYAGHIYTRDHNAFNCTAGAVLNVARESMARYGFSPATRVFEAAGAGACLVTDFWEGIEQFLEPETEVLVARDGAEVAEHLLALTPARARKIGDAARRRVLAAHTYTHRAAQVDDLLGARATLLAS